MRILKIERSKNKLHRVDRGKVSDWATLSSAKMNNWQLLAYRTRGIVTIGNFVTLLGGFLVITGLINLESRPGIGALLIFVGRVLDIYDGILADMTGTKSRLGAKIDETMDMILLAISLVVLATIGILPISAVLIIAAPKVLNFVSAIVGTIRKKYYHVTAQSKIATAILWLCLGSFILAFIFTDLKNLFLVIAWLNLSMGFLLSLPSSIHYAKIGIGSKVQK